MPNLFPVFQTPTILEETKKSEAVYKESYYFDYEKGDFALDGNGRVIAADGYNAWKQWCIKTIATQRKAYLNYTAGLGIDGDQAMAETSVEKQKQALETTIRDALLRDPYKRTIDVQNFEWSQGVDSLHMTCTIIGQDDRTAVIDQDIPIERSN